MFPNYIFGSILDKLLTKQSNMKKHILMMLAFYPPSNIKRAQSEEEILEWFQLHQTEIMPHWCYSNTIGCNQLTNKFKINREGVELLQEAGQSFNFTRIPWNKIQKIEDSGYGSIQIVCQEKHEGHNVFIILKLKNKERITKYTETLNSMATIKGAKLTFMI
jgi:hypothetical protein